MSKQKKIPIGIYDVCKTEGCGRVMLKGRSAYQRSTHYCMPCSRRRNPIMLKGSTPFTRPKQEVKK